MCHFVTAVLPASADLELLRGIASHHARALKALASPNIEKQLNPGEAYYLTTVGHCDCGTPLGQQRAERTQRLQIEPMLKSES